MTGPQVAPKASSAPRSSTRSRFIVIGGDAAGMSAAAQARRRLGEDALDIVVFERSVHTSYSACGLPYLVGDVVGSIDDLVVRTPQEHRARGIDVRIGHEVVAIDLDGGRVTVRDLAAGTDRVESYDTLMYATGAVPIRPPIPGIDAHGVFGLNDLDDGVALRSTVDAGTARRAVVVGAGYIGLEVAEALVRRGLDVTVLEAGDAPMPTLDPDMGALVADALRAIGVDLRTATRAEAIVTVDGAARGVVTGDEELPADLIVLGVGVRPNVGLARDAGLEIGPAGGISADDHMRASAEGVFTGGDCAESFHRLTGRPAVIALGTHANKHGRVVGLNVTGGDATFPGVVGTAVTKVCEYEVARTGLSAREAESLGLAHRSVTVESSSRAGYFPGATPITVKLVWAETDGRLLGAQIVGREGAAKRIDVISACLWNGMTVDEIQNLDLGYAPPFSPVWDPVLTAARVAAGRRGSA